MMNMNFFKTVVTVLVLAISSPVLAKGDAAAGKEKSVTCMACHGAEGISTNPQWPNLAGQVPGYIAGQLATFKSGERKNGVMAGMSAGLSNQDMADLDAYYSSLTAAKGSISEDQAELAAAGEKIYKGGIAERQIASCMSCHNPSGKGVPKHFPSVAGQHQAYLEAQLLAFKKGERKGYNQMMSSIAFGLSEQQIKALSVYMSGLN
ncbi:MAG: c-type cytochrome [Arenicella sp.]